MKEYMKSSEIRKRFIEYFTEQLKSENLEHKEIHSSPLVPERHPTLLFTNSGMVQFTPYFIGEKNSKEDFGIDRLCSVQKCIRTGDLDKVGKSKYHLTFFEMLGSWSIGDYGKGKAVEFAYDLLTNTEYGYGLDPEKFIATVFCGNDEAPCDTETIEAWKSVGISEEKISKLPAEENWWAPAGLTGPGPCGPCTEVLYDRGEEFGPEEKIPGMTDNPRYLEIWNAGVFMQYNRDESGNLKELDIQSVDTGAGLERFAVLLQGVDSVYETDIFLPIIGKIIELRENNSENRTDNENLNNLSQLDLSDENIKTINEYINNLNPDEKESIYRAAEHIKSSTLIMSEKVYPSNKDQGYVVRRLIRTAFNDFVWKLGIDSAEMVKVIPVIFEMYKDVYPEIGNAEDVMEMMQNEHDVYKKVTDNTRKFVKQKYIRSAHNVIDNPFDIYQSTGASRELIQALAEEFNIEIDFTNFEDRVLEHQQRSRSGAGDKFKGGLGDHTEETIKLHTATHLLHGALRVVLGDQVQQMGSNITPERLRFDFSHSEKLSDEQVEQVEKIVNEKIEASLPVNFKEMSIEDAEKTGALHFFKEKYSDKVKVYYIGDDLESAWSKEYCGGPHVTNTSELGHFKIQKQESVGKGVRRIKAVLEK